MRVSPDSRRLAPGSQTRGRQRAFGLGDAAYDAAQNKDAPRRFKKIPFRRSNPYTAEFEYFAEAILRGQAPELNGPDNALRILDWTARAYASTAGPRSGRR